jgi:hypothetical protein
MTRAGRRRVTAGLAVLLVAAVGAAQERRGELLDRTLAIVGGAVVMQSDATFAQSLGLLDAAVVPAAPDVATRLVDRWLMLHEVARFAPAEPSAAAVTARLERVRQRLGSAAAVEAALARSGRGADDLEFWVRDDLRIAAYLDQRFASAGAPAEADVAAWIAAHGEELARDGVSGADAARRAREQLGQARRADLIADWLADLRRRIEVVTFPG